MAKKTFGTRQAHSQIAVAVPPSDSLRGMDYFGIGILCVIFALLPMAIQNFESVSSIVSSICGALELPKGFGFELPVRSILVAGHQVSLVIGLGSTIFLDLYLMQFLFHRPINQQAIEVSEFGSSLVFIGLVLIWLSGISILLYYFVSEPTLLQNPKIWGKLVVVCALSVNGHFIHKYALPNLKHNLGRRVLDADFLTVAKSSLLFASISIVSWGFAFVLGAFKELNNIVSAPTILFGYMFSILVVYLIMIVTCWWFAQQMPQRKKTRSAIQFLYQPKHIS